MSTQWLAIKSFRRSQDLIDAINKLSIYLKLSLSGLESKISQREIADSRKKLTDFIDQYEQAREELAKNQNEPITGIDLRLRQFFRKLFEISSRKKNSGYSLLREPRQLKKYLSSNEPDEQKSLLDTISRIRFLLEEHIDSDTKQIIKDF